MNLSIWKNIAISTAAAGALGLIAMRERRRWRLSERGLYGRPGRWFSRAADPEAWSFDNRLQTVSPGQALRIETMSPAIVRWSTDGWKTVHETRTRRAGGGLEAAELDTSHLPAGSHVQFTFFWPEVNRWEGQDFEVRVAQRARYGGAAGV